MMKRFYAHKKSERGQGFMEMAISMLFLLILFSALVDLGWAFYTLISLRDAVQEAASYASMCPDRLDLVKERLYNSAAEPVDMSKIGEPDIQYCTPGGSCRTSGTKRGDYIRISVTYQHNIVTPFIGAIINTQSYPLTVTVSDTILRDKCP